MEVQFSVHNAELRARMIFRVRMSYLWGPYMVISVLGFTHVVEELSFPMIHSILTFEFGLILRSFLTFWGPNGLFLGLG